VVAIFYFFFNFQAVVDHSVHFLIVCLSMQLTLNLYVQVWELYRLKIGRGVPPHSALLWPLFVMVRKGDRCRGWRSRSFI